MELLILLFAIGVMFALFVVFGRLIGWALGICELGKKIDQINETLDAQLRVQQALLEATCKSRPTDRLPPAAHPTARVR